jgi:hypothetical protein
MEELKIVRRSWLRSQNAFLSSTVLVLVRRPRFPEACSARGPKKSQFGARRASCMPRMQERRGDSEINESADDDDRLHRELTRKVRELYGGRENVAIVTEGQDDAVEFRVRQGPGGIDFTTYRTAWFTIGGVLACAVVSLGLFTFLLKTGAVHDAAGTKSRHAMPSYGSRTYINPYELLQEDTPVIK